MELETLDAEPVTYDENLSSAYAVSIYEGWKRGQIGSELRAFQHTDELLVPSQIRTLGDSQGPTMAFSCPEGFVISSTKHELKISVIARMLKVEFRRTLLEVRVMYRCYLSTL